LGSTDLSGLEKLDWWYQEECIKEMGKDLGKWNVWWKGKSSEVEPRIMGRTQRGQRENRRVA